MPSLDYSREVPVFGAYAYATAVPRWYDGSTPDRTTRPCPRCRRPADPVLGHGHDNPACARLERDNMLAKAAASGTRRRKKGPD